VTLPDDPGPPNYGRRAPGGRNVTSLLARVRGLDVRQEQFVPSSGAFVRNVVWLTNPGLDSVTLDVELRAELGARTDWELRAESSGDGSLDTDDTWAFARVAEMPPDGEEAGLPAREGGAVFGTGASATQFEPGADGEGFSPPEIRATFPVTVPAGQRVGLMAFALGRRDNQGTLAQVRALADFSDPEALEGLSETDRQQIVNCVVPATPNPATGVEGTVTHDGVPSPGAPVAALDPVSGLVRAYGVANATGQFALRGLSAGDVRLLAVDPATNRPGTTTATVSEGSSTTVAIAAIPAAAMGTIQGTVSNDSAMPIWGIRVTATSDDFAPLWQADATTDVAGRYSLQAPQGSVHVRARDYPSSENLGILDSGGTLVLDLTVPVVDPPTGVAGTVTADGVPSPDATVVALDPVEGFELAYATTNASGYFVLLDLPVGDVRIVTVDPSTNRPGATTSTVTLGSVATADVAVIPATDMGTIQGTVTNDAGEPVEYVYVAALSDVFPSLWIGQAISGPSGEYSLAAPPGTIRVHAYGDSSLENSGPLDPGGTLVLNLRVP
jgi:hypothetical protein